MSNVETEILVISIGTVSSFVSGWLLHLLNEFVKKKKEIALISKSLIHELTDVKQYIEKRERPAFKVVDKPDGDNKTINFKGHSLSHFAYDSIIYSGAIRDFHVDTQYKLALIYGKIRRSNLSTEKIFDLAFRHESVSLLHLDNIKNFTENYEKELDGIAVNITEMIAILSHEMNNKRASSTEREHV